jgi:arsenite-transporting ATPase
VRAARTLAENSPDLHIRQVVLNRTIASAAKCERCMLRLKMTRSAEVFLKKNFRGVRLLRGEDTGGPVMGARGLLDFGRHVFARKRIRAAAAPPRAADVGLRASEWPKLSAPLSLTIGKGGVGKTTISAALAYHARKAQRAQVVICSTDPAPSLDDVFQAPIGDTPRPVMGDRRLKAMEIDSVAGFRAWSDELKGKLNSAFGSDKGGLHVDLSFDRDIIHALLDIVPPGVDEILAIFRILDLLETAPEGARVVIDMAPTGHSLELLRMPDRMLLWSRLLLKSLAPHRTLPLAQDLAVEIAAVSQRVRELALILKSRARSQVWVAMLAEPLPDRETQRLLAALEHMGAPLGGLFVNRVIFDSTSCRRCRRARQWQLHTLAALRKRSGGRKLMAIREFDHEIAGPTALKSLTREIWRIA